MDNNTRQRLLALTHNMIMRYGISSVTMDIIAKECKVSKRTLYEAFTDKASLVKEVLDWHRQSMKNKLAEISNNSTNTLETLLKSIAVVRESMNNISEVFFTEVSTKYSPAREECDRIESQIIEGLAVYFAKGQSEGIFLSHYDSMYLARVFIYSTLNFRLAYEKVGNISNTLDYLDVMRECFIRGIVTQKGLEIYNEFYNNDNKNY
ncbi:MAG: TetR/AcrR family transcriptional regulator [Muribaculaceae bacterium]|nr:TetR/AcrR family transcriptional regulator [Muribaculaceae bacterium]